MGYKHALLVYMQLFFQQYPQVLLHRTALNHRIIKVAKDLQDHRIQPSSYYQCHPLSVGCHTTNLFIPESVVMFGIALNQVQHLILLIAELHEVHLSPPLRVPLDVPLESLPSTISAMALR